MPISPIGRTLDELDTPALLLDLDAFEANVRTMSDHLRSRNVAWRPHAKAFKCPAIAHATIRAGAIGVTVAKVSEAEVMADGGIADILIAHLVVGPSKVDRLAALQKRAEVNATVDHPAHLEPIAEAARRVGVEVGLLVDVDLGMGRCGVRDLDAAVELARQIARTPGLRFDGLMGYEGHLLTLTDPETKRRAIGEAIGHLLRARDAVEAAGLPCRIVSAGGSGSYQITADLPGVTEVQAGGGVFACRYYTEVCRVRGHRPAIGLLATVVGRPEPGRAILDIGRKSISDHTTPPFLPDHPGCRVLGLSAEHATVEVGGGSDLSIGDRVLVTPGYSDLTTFLHDRIIGHRGNRVEAAWALGGRGMLQ